VLKLKKNDSYTSPIIQKENLYIFSTKVMEAIRKEIDRAKFCIIVDEARDESMNEQMAIVLRFVENLFFLGLFMSLRLRH
jgi:predicted nucleotide-binding protein